MTLLQVAFEEGQLERLVAHNVADMLRTPFRGVLREIGVPTEVIDSNGARHMTRHDSETIYGKLGYNA